MLNFLFTPLARYVLVAVLAISALFAAFLKGQEYEQGRHSQATLKALNTQLNEAIERNKKTNLMLQKYATQRAQLKKETNELQKRLQDTLQNQPVYQECKSTQETADKLNELLK